jgi:hypothetical protein
MRRCTPLLLALPLLLLVSSCDEGNPIAPSGSFLILSANPSRISLNGTSVITVTGRRPDGNPLSDGTEVLLSTSLGNISPSVVEIDGDGNATATLRGDGRQGTATITASVGTSGGGGGGDGEGGGGAGVGSSTLEVQIGEDETTTPTLRVTANPDTLPAGDDSRSTITVIARNSDGTPVESGRTVVLTTSLGRLTNSRPTTDSEGTATTTLIAGLQSGTATLTASVGNSEIAETTVEIRTVANDITVQAARRNVTVGAEPETINITALAIDTDGLAINNAQVTFEASAGTLTQTVDLTNPQGLAETMLTLTQDDVPVGMSTVTIRARTPSGSGEFIEDTTTITVTR